MSDREVLYEEALGSAVDTSDLARRLGEIRGTSERIQQQAQGKK